MSEYWKSIPKKYCDFCKCYITDNKASRDFHERGFRHLANVRKRVQEIQRNSTTQEKELQQYNISLQKIEAAALNSFQADLKRDPSLTGELSNLKSSISRLPSNSAGSSIHSNRFGETCNESETLVNGKKRALETIASAFEKKRKWLERKTAEGTIFYWNKETLESRRDPPKSGFLSLKDQDEFKNVTTANNPDDGTENQFKFSLPSPYGNWKTIENVDGTKLVDLQLPGQNLSEIMLNVEQQNTNDQEIEKPKTIQFKEKTHDTLKRPISSSHDQSISFKKKSSVKRNIRSRTDCD